MSVTATDLKSMLNKVRKADLPPPATEPDPVPAKASPASEPQADRPGTSSPSDEDDGSYAVEAILEEINRDEELLLRILGLLYRAKKRSPNSGAVSIIPMEKKLGLERESATFVINYMKARKLIETNDKSANMITVDGIEYLRAKLTK